MAAKALLLKNTFLTLKLRNIAVRVLIA